MKVRSILFALLALVGFSSIAIAADYDDVANFRAGIGRLSRTVGATFTTADPNPSRDTLRANQVFLIDTTTNAVDLDFSDNADLEAIDFGTQWSFIVSVGHATQALTVTNGASGVVVTTLNTLGTTCEDTGDHIVCTAFAL